MADDSPTASAAETPEVAETYAQLLARRRDELATVSKREFAISMSRLAVAVAGLVLLWLAIQSRLFSPWWLLTPVALFAALMVVHDRFLRRRQRLERAVSYYERGLARLEDQWAGTGETGELYADADHPYASDLDLFGRGSLFELISVARTRQGESELAAWLLKPAAPDEITSRPGGCGGASRRAGASRKARDAR